MGRFKIFSIYPKTEQEAWLYLDMANAVLL